MINEQMDGKLLTEAIADFLRGPWYDSIQLLLLTKGFEGEEWDRAEKLTETIIWTYQPIVTPNQPGTNETTDEEADADPDTAAVVTKLTEENETFVQSETQRLYRIIEHLSSELRELLVALDHTSEAVETAIE
tara:strand:+ start:125 stop:523 length:399 start_codon:yes stop_codon:yes gene_type:complete